MAENIKNYRYKKYKFIKDSEIEDLEDPEEIEYIKYIISGEYINISSEITFINWDIKGFNDAPSSIIKDDNNQWVLKIKKLDNVYEYKGSVTVTTNFGSYTIDNFFFELQKEYAPYLDSNESYDESTGRFSYKVTKNNQSIITYKMTGDNIRKNNDITFVNWEVEGFNNCATIDNNGIITITKNKELYNEYEGYVTVTTNFGTFTQNIKFDDNLPEIYDINLCWNNNEGIETEKYEVLGTITRTGTNEILSFKSSYLYNKLEIPFYFQIQDNKSDKKLTNEKQLENLLPNININDRNDVTIEVRASWENFKEINAIKQNYGDYEITASKYYDQYNPKKLKELKFKPYSSDKYGYITLKKSQKNNHTLYIEWTYSSGSNDPLSNYIDEFYKKKEDLPYIEIYCVIYKGGVYYNTTSSIKLHLGALYAFTPTLTNIAINTANSKNPITKKLNDISYKYIECDFEDADASCILKGTNLNTDIVIDNITWTWEGFNNNTITFENKNSEWIMHISDKENDNNYGIITVTNNYGSASMYVWLFKSNGYKPILYQESGLIDLYEHPELGGLFNDNLMNPRLYLEGENLVNNTTKKITNSTISFATNYKDVYNISDVYYNASTNLSTSYIDVSSLLNDSDKKPLEIRKNINNETLHFYIPVKQTLKIYPEVNITLENNYGTTKKSYSFTYFSKPRKMHIDWSNSYSEQLLIKNGWTTKVNSYNSSASKSSVTYKIYSATKSSSSSRSSNIFNRFNYSTDNSNLNIYYLKILGTISDSFYTININESTRDINSASPSKTIYYNYKDSQSAKLTFTFKFSATDTALLVSGTYAHKSNYEYIKNLITANFYFEIYSNNDLLITTNELTWVGGYIAI